MVFMVIRPDRPRLRIRGRGAGVRLDPRGPAVGVHAHDGARTRDGARDRGVVLVPAGRSR